MAREASPESRGVPDTFRNPSESRPGVCTEPGYSESALDEPRREDTVPFRRETAVRAGVHPFTVSLEPDMRGVADLVQKCAVNRVAGWMPNGMLGRAARDHLDPNTKAGLKKAHDYLTLAVRMLNGIANDLEDARVKLERAASRKKGGR